MQERGKTGGDGFEDAIDTSLTCLVQWTGASIDTLDAHSVLAYGDAVINVPSDNAFLAQQRPIFEASAPAAATDQFVITTEPIVGQQIGRAVCAGLAVVQIDVSDAGHTRAVPVASETGFLASAASGGVPILWKEAGTGVLWSVVLMDQGSSGGGSTNLAHGVLTEATGAATIQPRTLSAGTWINNGSAIADVGYPVQIDGDSFLAKPTAKVIYFEEPTGSGVYAILPIQYADLVTATYYPGFLSTGSQTIKGAKTFVDNASFSGNVTISGDVLISGATSCSSISCSTIQTSSDIQIGGGLTVNGTVVGDPSGRTLIAQGKLSATSIAALGTTVSAATSIDAGTFISAGTEFRIGATAGITATKSFVDNNGNTVDVEITGGIITDWTSTPPPPPPPPPTP